MSTPLNNPFFGQSDDPREVELIQNLAEKTREGKIPWVKQGNAITATVPSGLQINFVLSPISFMITVGHWQLLTVRDSSGSELVKVNNNQALFSVINGGSPPALVSAADELFKLVTRAGNDDLDRAIRTIKKL